MRYAFLAMAGGKNAPTTHKPHKRVFQVSDDDARKWNLTLINARNVQAEMGKANVAIDMLRIESEVAPKFITLAPA